MAPDNMRWTLNNFHQLDISDDGFLSLMNDDGDTKDDVKMPDGEVGEKINRLFKTEEKDTSKFTQVPNRHAKSIIPFTPP